MKNKKSKKIVKTTITVILGVLVLGLLLLFVLSKSINMVSPNLGEVIKQDLPVDVPEFLQAATLYLTESEGALKSALTASSILFAVVMFVLIFGEKIVSKRNKRKQDNNNL